jgi:hypothetical protein
MTERKLSRCAIYTRKSTEHNLDLEFIPGRPAGGLRGLYYKESGPRGLAAYPSPV